MSQSDFGTIDPNSKSGPQLALDLNKFRDALNSGHRGSARPAYAQAGMQWVRETSSTQWDLMFFDGDTDFVLRSVNPATNTLLGIPQNQIEGLSATFSDLDSKYVGKDSATGAATLPSGTTAQRPASPVAGMTRYNTTLAEYERYQGGAWVPLNVMDKALNEAPVVTIASASTVNIGAATANTINISGTATITSFGTIAAGATRRLVFQGALTLTHNAVSLILPGAANITTVAGDVAEFMSLGGWNWKCLSYMRASGEALSAATPFTKEFVSDLLPISIGGGITQAAHNFGVPPKLVQATLVFQVAYQGWAAGEECIAMIGPDRDDSATYGSAVYWDNTNIYWRYGASGLQVYNKTTGAQSGQVPSANVRLKIKVWA